MLAGPIPQKRMESALRRVLTAHGLEHPLYAVALPVLFGEAGAELLIEVRAAGISQAGDPCFPGGRMEFGETPKQAAVRELAEELGIIVGAERFLGQLPTVQTYLGSKTDIFVCLVTPEEAKNAVPNPAEVAELLRAPLEFFLNSPDAASFHVDGHTVWGMTAGAVRGLCAAWREAVELL